MTPTAAATASAPDPTSTAGRLHEAHVGWLLARTHGDLLRAEVDAAVASFVAPGTRLRDLVDPATARHLLTAAVLGAARSPGAATTVGPLAVAAHHELGQHDVVLREVVSRDAVSAVVTAALALRGDGQVLTERLLASASAVRVGVRLVGAVVADVLQQNRALAERLPGVGGLISLGTSLGGGALSRAGALGKAVVGDSSLERLVGDAVGAGAQVTMRRTTAIVHQVVDDEALLAIALELYDAYAETPVSELRLTATDDQVRELADRAHALVAEAAGSPRADDLLGAVLEEWWSLHGDQEVSDLLARLTLDQAALSDLVVALLEPSLARARSRGALEPLVRERTAGFWGSPEVAAALAGDATA